MGCGLEDHYAEGFKLRKDKSTVSIGHSQAHSFCHVNRYMNTHRCLVKVPFLRSATVLISLIRTTWLAVVKDSEPGGLGSFEIHSVSENVIVRHQ